ncbi:hypothetical protein EVJ58_g3482 [Rhodofomes roseus]|uniref:Uncharacterized protein n=1 Tax=Rhodofomes roseus TaxID=34475 RepID=A0A4Y9YM44_9APHY|nr:hypothetical protein EVJ58_g3482 [Rhodofomes roseus]
MSLSPDDEPTPLDYDTARRITVAARAVKGLEEINKNLTAVRVKMKNLKVVTANIKAGESPTIAHPRICSVSRTLIRTASACILVADALLDKAPAGAEDDIEALRLIYPQLSGLLEVAMSEVDALDTRGVQAGYIAIQEEFLAGPRARHLVLPKCTCLCHIHGPVGGLNSALMGPSYFANVPRYDTPGPLHYILEGGRKAGGGVEEARESGSAAKRKRED